MLSPTGMMQIGDSKGRMGLHELKYASQINRRLQRTPDNWSSSISIPSYSLT
jgi:hypothetical protein